MNCNSEKIRKSLPNFLIALNHSVQTTLSIPQMRNIGPLKRYMMLLDNIKKEETEKSSVKKIKKNRKNEKLEMRVF